MNSLRKHLSYANVVATMALVFAMGGSAIAASHYLIDSTRQINPKVLKKLRGNAGKRGATGTQGSPGLKGEAGAKGEPGLKGEQGAAGPLLASLPSGKTLTGVYEIDSTSGGTAAIAGGSISFEFPLASAPNSKIILQGESPSAECPGSPAAPQAQPGFLCVYEEGHQHRASLGSFNPETGLAGAGVGGAGLVLESEALAGSFYDDGAWAITAP
jgi:hypothetical protein